MQMREDRMTVDSDKRLRAGLTKNAKPGDEAQTQERRKMTMSEGLKYFGLVVGEEASEAASCGRAVNCLSCGTFPSASLPHRPTHGN